MKITRTRTSWVVILTLLAVVIIVAFYPLTSPAPVQYYDRQNGLLKTEKIAGEKWLHWLYDNPLGEATLWMLVKRKMVSSFYGKYMDHPTSAKKIKAFVSEFEIDMSNSQKQEFSSFNDFFTRKLKNNARPLDTGSTVAVSPADGKVLAYSNLSNSDFIIKGYRFNIWSFLNHSRLARKYYDGSLVIIRLAPSDYHRFHFPVSGSLSSVTSVEGDYYSVSPLALRKRAEILCLNKREFTIISNPLFRDVLMAEVGATMVGSIVQTYSGNIARKGEEKGYFRFGGSTVVLLFEKNKIRIDGDLLMNTLKGYETSIMEGQRIGEAVIGPTLPVR
jgi:phosphatidylserine decarboxylase